jgi:hypothetical protein
VGAHRLGIPFTAEKKSTVLKAHRFLIAMCATGVVALCACSSPVEQVQQKSEKPYVVNNSSLGFDIQPIPSEGSKKVWLATYTAWGTTAKFRMEFDSAKPIDDKDARKFDIQSGEGRFIAEAGSDARIMLADLQRVLGAKVFPRKSSKVKSLPFTFVSFGSNESRSPDGGFSYEPAGGWTPMKIFIGENDEGQVFLNINPDLGKGEFSIKDSDYGNFVLAQLARVL